MTANSPEPSPTPPEPSAWPWRVRYALYGGTALAVVVALGVWDARRGADVADGRLVDIPQARQWWQGVAVCLHDPTPYPEGVRFYVGTRIPSSWLQYSDVGGSFGGYTDTYGQRVMLMAYGVTDSALVAHEVWHVVHGASHPVSVFGDPKRGLPPRCGLASP